MAKTRQQKQDEVQSLTALLKEMKSGVVAAFTHVKVADERKLREGLKQLDGQYRVVKKSLLALALKEMKLAHEFLDAVRGTIVLAIGRGDMVAPVKEIAKFAKGKNTFGVEGGFLNEDGAVRVLSKEEVGTLATMPGREELIARAVGAVRAPLSGMVQVLSGVQRNFVQVLNAIQKAKG